VISQDAIREALVGVIDPEIRRSVVELDMVRGVDVAGEHVDVTLALTVAGCPMKANLEQQVRERVGAVEGVATVGVTFDVMTPAERTALRSRLQGEGGTVAPGAKKPVTVPASTTVIAVASGKGGVGKSSLTANLAASLAAGGAEVGVIDADIYGYSIPRMLGISRKPIVVDGMIVPPVNHGIKIMSIGFFIDEDGAVLWRGPMLHRALEQFLTDVHWGEIDYLVVDMPPGTGDVAISLGQLLPSPQLVLVTTPQQAAQAVARRAAEVADKTGMKLAGVIENMSYAVCSCCGERTHPFGQGGGAELAEGLGVDLLGQVPMDERLRECGDDGEPLIVSQPDSPAAVAIGEIAETLVTRLAPKVPAAARIKRPLGVV
jgi:ATP-binding protein involved in chromosome partitioning